MENPQLFFIHFAGGSCYSFQNITNLLTNFDVVCLELPGRGMRMSEPLIKDFHAASRDLYLKICNELRSSKFILFGYSMGAYLAFNIAKMLENTNKFPSHLIVGGNPGPGAGKRTQRYLLDRENFIKALRKLGGVPEEILQDNHLFNFFEPVLRSDFEVAEEHDLDGSFPIKSPIYAIMGDEDDHSEKISNWANFTSTKFNYKIFKGGHFFIQDCPEGIAEVFSDCMVI